MINAEHARNLTISGLGRAVITQMEVIEQCIKNAAANGNNSVTILDLYSENIETLRSNGFRVNKNQDAYKLHSVNYYNISWDE